jgi:hypothetical protein
MKKRLPGRRAHGERGGPTMKDRIMIEAVAYTIEA